MVQRANIREDLAERRRWTHMAMLRMPSRATKGTSSCGMASVLGIAAGGKSGNSVSSTTTSRSMESRATHPVPSQYQWLHAGAHPPLPQRGTTSCARPWTSAGGELGGTTCLHDAAAPLQSLRFAHDNLSQGCTPSYFVQAQGVRPRMHSTRRFGNSITCRLWSGMPPGGLSAALLAQAAASVAAWQRLLVQHSARHVAVRHKSQPLAPNGTHAARCQQIFDLRRTGPRPNVVLRHEGRLSDRHVHPRHLQRTQQMQRCCSTTCKAHSTLLGYLDIWRLFCALHQFRIQQTHLHAVHQLCFSAPHSG